MNRPPSLLCHRRHAASRQHVASCPPPPSRRREDMKAAICGPQDTVNTLHIQYDIIRRNMSRWCREVGYHHHRHRVRRAGSNREARRKERSVYARYASFATYEIACRRCLPGRGMLSLYAMTSLEHGFAGYTHLYIVRRRGSSIRPPTTPRIAGAADVTAARLSFAAFGPRSRHAVTLWFAATPSFPSARPHTASRVRATPSSPQHFAVTGGPTDNKYHIPRYR